MDMGLIYAAPPPGGLSELAFGCFSEGAQLVSAAERHAVTALLQHLVQVVQAAKLIADFGLSHLDFLPQRAQTPTGLKSSGTSTRISSLGCVARSRSSGSSPILTASPVDSWSWPTIRLPSIKYR